MRSLKQRLERKYIPEPNTGCWLWEGTVIHNGYGIYNHNVAHRVSYEEFIGKIPEGLDLDHLCHTRCCINPYHLEPVTRSENLRRGIKITGCKNGHPYIQENYSLINRKNGRYELRCKLCHRKRNGDVKHRNS